MIGKSELRKTARAKRQAMAPAQVDTSSNAIARALLAKGFDFAKDESYQYERDKVMRRVEDVLAWAPFPLFFFCCWC